MCNLILIKFENEISHKESDMDLEFITNFVLQEFPKSNFFILNPEDLQFIQYVKGFQKLNININAGLNLLYDKYPEFITNEIHNIILNIPFNHEEYNLILDDIKDSISKPLVIDKWKYKLSYKDFYDCLNIDFTHNEKYLNWLCFVNFNYGINNEDHDKIRTLLEDFDKPQVKALIKKSGYSIDIMDYEDNNDLFKVVNECYYSKLDDVEANDRKILYQKRKIFEDENWLVVVPESHQEAVTIGRGTNWCTSADSEDGGYNYHNYTVDSEGVFYNLYIFINKNDETQKYQYSELECIFLDWNDNDFNIIEVFDIEFVKEYVKLYENNIVENNKIPYDFNKFLIDNNLYLDKYINSEDDWLRRAVAKTGYGLDILINDPNEMVRVMVVNRCYGLDILINDKSEMIRHKANKFLQEIESGELQPYINDYGFKCYE